MPKYSGMPAAEADAYRGGALDANGQKPETAVSDGTAPCRCCLKLIKDGEPMLVLAYRPFQTIQPYAEIGPIFICAKHCHLDDTSSVPDVLVSPTYLLKAYSHDERIIYGTGQITPRGEVPAYADALLARSDVAFVDLRSALNNCWQVRMTRGAVNAQDN